MSLLLIALLAFCAATLVSYALVRWGAHVIERDRERAREWAERERHRGR